VEEAAAAAQSLQEQAGSLSHAVSVFKLDGQPMIRPVVPLARRTAAQPARARQAIAAPQREQLAAAAAPSGDGDWETF
jgi:methyl-accepting chemotaxis protein